MLYHQAAAGYTWGDLFPLPAGRKSPPPEGYTGEHGRQVSDQDRAAWAMHTGNVGLRVPDGVVGLDVDQYGDKRGGDTLAAMEAQLGPLPLGPMSTGRDPRTGSGIRFFRYPGGKLAGVLGEAVEVIQHGHRYAVAWPSVVEDRAYQWWQWLPPMGVWQKVGVPRLEDLPELPAPWVEYLASRAAASVGPAAPATDRDQLLAELVSSTQPACGALDALAGAGVAKLEEAGEGGRHDAMTGAVLALVLAAAEGHTGFVDALDTLEAAWDAAIADQDRRGEFARMVSTAAAKAAAKYPASIRASLVHLCRVGNPGIPGTVPQAVQAGPGAPGAPVPALAQEPEVFDPLGAWTERDVARAILLHKAPVLRFARDAQGWLTRRGHRWELDPASLTDGAKSIVESVSHKAPRGSSTADAGTPDHERAQRYKRMTNAAGVGALATMLKAAAPNEPWLAVNLAELDNDPEVLWAGGLAWDLRASRGGLVVADLDPNTPHLAAAAAGPDLRPTPLWDRFMEAAFPNLEQRAWVLRLFGVSATGHADAVLPILYGPPGTGKTTAIKLVAQALGSYAVAAQAAILDGSGGKSSSVEEFALLGKRMAWVDEGPRSSRWANERLKALTGGGSMRARPLYKAEVEWVPTHTLFLSSNDYPQVADPGLRRRVRAVQVDGDAGAVKAAVRSIVGARKLWAQELPGVLGRLVLEAAEYLADPTSADNPLAVEADLESLAREQDPLLSWLDDRTAPGGPTKSMELWDDFRAYADRIGTLKNLLPGLTGWGRRLSQLGYPAAHGRDGKTRPLELKRGGFHGPVTGLAPSGLVTLPAPTGHRPSSPETGGSEVESTAGDQLRDQFVTGSPANWSQAEALVPAGLSTVGEQCDQFPPYNPTKGGVIVTPRVRAREGEILESSDLDPQPVTTGHAVTIEAPSEAAPEAVPAPPPAGPAKAPRAKAAPKPRAPRPTGVAALEGPFLELPALVVRGHDVPAPTTLADAAALLGPLAGATVWLDVEHSGFPVGHVHYQLRTIQLGTADWALVLDAQDLEHRGLAVQVLDRAAEIVAHSATADVSLVALAALVPSDPWWAKTTDTAILAALADPALTGAHSRKGALQLKVLAEHLVPDPVAPAADKARAAVFRKGKWLTDTEATTPLERSGWANVPIGHPDMVTYGASDVLDTGRLSEVLPKPAPALLERERGAQRILARLPERGLLLDAERVELHLAEHEARRDQAAARLADMGLTEPGSNDQVGRALLALGAALPATKTGKPSTAAEVVDKLAATEGSAQPLARALLEYREHEKLIGTYLLPAAVQCRHGDGRSRPTILTLGAVATGRMSSVRPNIQNVPRPTKAEAKPGGGGGMRGMYLADPGWRFIAADFSSVEVRIAAAVTGDDTLAHMVREGIDLHGEIVKLAWGMDPTDPVFGEVRYQAKRCIAEGQRVLTDAGLIPIESVTTDQRVWDGLEWVGHSGVVAQGVRDVLTYQGLTATPDHVVYTEDANTVCLGYAAEHGINLASTAVGAQPRHLPGHYWASVPEGEPRVPASAVHAVWARGEEEPKQHRSGQGAGVPLPSPGQVHGAGEDSWEAVRRGQAAMHTGHAVRQGVRGPRNPGLVRVQGALRPVDCGEPSTRGLRDGGDRQDRLGRSLRAGEPAFDGSPREQLEHSRHAVCHVHGPAGCPQSRPAPAAAGSPGHGVRAEAHHTATEPRTHAGSDPRHGAQWARAQTYDIGNAGPGHRFTVSGHLVANCVFGYLYGAGIPRLSAQLGEHGDKAQAVVDALKALTPTLIGWDKGLREAVRAGTVKTWTHPSGRVAYFNRDLPHKALNLVVQGYGRELLVDAMERWEAMHPGMTVLPIHDELVVQCESELAEQYTEDLVACMTTEVGEGAARVPIVAEADPPTRRWGTVE